MILLAVGLCSCNQSTQSTSDSNTSKTLDVTKNSQNKKQLIGFNEKYINTKYEYIESNGERIKIQNSLPKSSLNYSDPDGNKYVYAVFWTRIINETLNPQELTIDFPKDSFEIPSSSGNFMKLLLPSENMTIEKEPLSDYGLNVKSFLDNNLHKPASLKRTINPKDLTTFYVVTLSNRGVNGTLRTGLSLKGQNLFYRINDKEVSCGNMNLKKLVSQK